MEQIIHSTLTEVRNIAKLESAAKIGRAQIEALADKEHWFHYTTPAKIEADAIRVEFGRAIQVRQTGGCSANVVHGSVLPEDLKKLENYRDVCSHVFETMMDPTVWTTGVDSAWVSGEYNGYYYNAYWMGRKIRFAVHRTADCIC